MSRVGSWAFLFSVGLSGCASYGPVAPAVTPAMTAQAGGVPGATLEEGRHIFTRQCTACHTADPVAKFTPVEWKAIVADMAERSEIDERQQAAVMAYILAARASVLARPGS